MPMHRASRWLACLCALPLLTSCGLIRRPAVVTRVQTVEVPVIAYRPIPAELTAPIPKPPRPPLLCELDGRAVMCVLDALATIPAWDAAVELCNEDRRKTRLLGGTDGL